MENYMPSSLFNAAIDGDTKVLNPQNKEMLYTTPDQQNNILHIAVRYGKLYFIKQVIRLFPALLQEKNRKGNTPLHEAAALATKETVQCLISSLPSTTTAAAYLKEVNEEGDTPFHVAIRSSNMATAEELFHGYVKEHSEILLLKTSVYEETPLHLYVRFFANGPHLMEYNDIDNTFFHQLVEANLGAMFEVDWEGMNPLMRAAHYGRVHLIVGILKTCPQSMECRDSKGSNFMHHLRLKFNARDKDHTLHVCRTILGVRGVDILSYLRDENGNTPIHSAILAGEFELLQLILEWYVDKKMTTIKTLIMNIKNFEGKTILDLIASEPRTPLIVKQALVPLRAMVMDGNLFYAAQVRDINMLNAISAPKGDNANSENDYEKWLGEAHDGTNVIHIALQHSESKEDTKFIEAVLEKQFKLIYRKDFKGDTPLHLAAGLRSEVAIDFFKICDKRWTEVVSSDSRNTYLPPWKLKNSKGNTFFHEAAGLFNHEVVFSKELEARVNEIKGVRNDKGETLLHVIARSATSKAKTFLENLSNEMKSVMYIQDVDGFTPLLKAVQYGCIKVATLLYPHCRLSTKIPDNKGRTILHHLRALAVDFVDDVNDIYPVWRAFYDKCHLEELRTVQDEDGNTALHSAIIEGDSIKVKFLMDKCLKSTNKLELYVVNNAGQTVFDLVSSSQTYLPGQAVTSSSSTSTSSSRTQKELLQPLVNRIYVKERELVDEIMEDELYKAAVDGRIDIFEGGTGSDPTRDIENNPPYGREYFCSQTPGGSCIIHISLRHGKENVKAFIEKALEKYPILSTRPDSNGDTPLHLAAKWKSGENGKQIMDSLVRAAKTSTDHFHVLPWAVKNNKGSFPIHEALQSGNLKAADILLDSDNDPDAASRVNDLGEIALHTFARNCFLIGVDEVNKFVNELLEKNKKALYMRDDEGLTPLLRASKSGRLEVAEAILRCSPQSAYVRDLNGRTFLHLLNFTGGDVAETLDDYIKKKEQILFKIPEADAQRLVQDYDGNTPLHYTIKNGNTVAAIVLTYRCVDSVEQTELRLLNKAGETIPDLVKLDFVPNEIVALIQDAVPEAFRPLPIISYGMPKKDMKESANALSVVAALFATISFTAAFQVPGGFEDDGYPILLSKVAFAIFFVANITAMCSSMLCLFLLFSWLTGIGKVHGSFKILDFSMVLLRISFYLTLLTFTTGVFVTTTEKSLWMGLMVCLLGFLTFLLTFKYPIKLVINFGEHVETCINKWNIKPIKS